MRRYITIIVAAIALHSAAVAQEILGAKVSIQEFEYHQDSVKVNIEFLIDDLKIGANRSAVFAPKIYKGDNTLELPTLVVRRRGGARSYDRAQSLENEKSIEAYQRWYGTPYEIIEQYGQERQSLVKYSVTTPYQRWMVESELYVDCSTCGCCSTEDEGAIVPDDNQLLIDIPTVVDYDVAVEVELITPEKVAIKRRDVQYSAALIFKVNSTYIDPNLERNRAELNSIDEMMQEVISDSDYTITKVNIIGYASPEGSLASNMKLSEGRAAALKRLMERKYRVIKPELYSVKFGGENWAGLLNIVSQSEIEEKDDIVSLIENISIEDGRESQLMALNGGATYKYLLKNIFPATRLVLVDVEFNVDAYDMDRIVELIDTKPQNLSLEEMYRLSERYNAEDAEFEKIFLTAAEIYPDDEVAQNNALTTEIRRGNIEAVAEVAERVDPQTESAELANSLGAYYMLSGDYDSAGIMLQRAIELGSERAQRNQEQLTAKLENIRQKEESEAFRAKIYGEE